MVLRMMKQIIDQLQSTRNEVAVSEIETAAKEKGIEKAKSVGSQYFLAIDVHSSESSQQTSSPSSGRALAMTIELYPVNVPISSARLAPINLTSKAMNWPCSGAICISENLIPAVSSRSCANRSDSFSDTESR